MAQITSAAPPIIIIQPSRGWRALDLRELWRFRELVYFLALRDVKVRYKQTVLGVAWVLLQPLLAMGIFSIVFGQRGLTTNGEAYPLIVVSALVPVVFVAKSEVAGWPLFGWLAKLQRTIFINRQARHQTGAATREIAGRLLGGDAVVLFAEGTSSDGGRVLPFRSSLVGAVHHALGAGADHTRSLIPI